MALVISDLLNERQIALDLRAGDAAGAIREIVGLLGKNAAVLDPTAFCDALITREQVHPTATENGVAFPHARTDLVKSIVLAIGRSRAGVHFEGASAPVHLLFVIGTPKQMVNDYLLCVGALARLAKDNTVRAHLLRAETTTDFVAALLAKA